VLDDEGDEREDGVAPAVSTEALEPQVSPDDLDPSIDAPSAPDVPDTDAASPALRQAFWKLVAVLNLALFALALGPMLVVFRGQWQAGGLVTFVGAMALFVAVRRYRTTKQRLQADTSE
jgi:hypothetical protein